MTERPVSPTATSAGTSEETILSPRDAMVNELRQDGAIVSETVAEAMLTVPRHEFAPGESSENAYHADMALVTKRDGRGRAISSVSSAHIQAVMLEQADIQPGMRALGVGTGGCGGGRHPAGDAGPQDGVAGVVALGGGGVRAGRPWGHSSSTRTVWPSWSDSPAATTEGIGRRAGSRGAPRSRGRWGRSVVVASRPRLRVTVTPRSPFVNGMRRERLTFTTFTPLSPPSQPSQRWSIHGALRSWSTG